MGEEGTTGRAAGTNPTAMGEGGQATPRPMRRARREVDNVAELRSMLGRARVVRVGSHDAEGPFITPMSYGLEWADDAPTPTLWLHSAREGRKADAWAADPLVALELDEPMGVITGDFACAYSYAYMSVMATGRVTRVEDADEKAHGLALLMAHMAPGAPTEFSPEALERVAVWRVDVERLSGKRREGMPLAAGAPVPAPGEADGDETETEAKPKKHGKHGKAGKPKDDARKGGHGKGHGAGRELLDALHSLERAGDEAKGDGAALKRHKKAERKARERQVAKVLDGRRCDGCGHRCKLEAPRCGKGKKAQAKLLKKAGLA